MDIELEEIGDISAAVILGAPTLMKMGMVPYDDHIEFTRLGIDVPLVPERGALPVQLLRARNLTAEGVPLNWHQQARIQVGEPFRIVGPAVVVVPVRVRWPDPPQELD